MEAVYKPGTDKRLSGMQSTSLGTVGIVSLVESQPS